MEILVQANLLTVGLNDRTSNFDDLPIRMISVETAAEAVRCIRNDRFESVVSKWQLRDSLGGLFLRQLRMVKPDMTTIVLVDGDDPQQEIMARSIGVTAVLTEDCGDDLLIATVAEILGVEIPLDIQAVSPQKNRQKSTLQPVKK